MGRVPTLFRAPLLSVAVLTFTIAYGSAANLCSHSFSDSKASFDLSPIGDGTFTVPGGSGFYNFSVCGTVTCNGKAAVADQYSANFGCLQSWGLNNQDSALMTWNPLNPTDPKSGVILTYNSENTCLENPSFTRSASFRISCDEAATTPQGITTDRDDASCSIAFSFRSAAGCGSTVPSSNKLSPGWAVVIVMLVLVVLYCGCGMAYKRLAVGASGAESIPNVSFWRWAWGRLTCDNAPSDDMFYQGVSGGDGDDDAPPAHSLA